MWYKGSMKEVAPQRCIYCSSVWNILPLVSKCFIFLLLHIFAQMSLLIDLFKWKLPLSPAFAFYNLSLPCFIFSIALMTIFHSIHFPYSYCSCSLGERKLHEAGIFLNLWITTSIVPRTVLGT